MLTFFSYVFFGFLDLLMIPLLSALYLINTAKRNPKKIDGGASKTPILLIHGYCHNSSAWLYFLKKFKEEGRDCVFTVNLGHPFSSIEKHAETVQKMAQNIAQITGRDDLILIGHSMGGLVATYYAACLAPPGKVVSITTIASPLNGAKLADYSFHLLSKQMRVGSPLTQLLQYKMKDSPIKYLHIGSPYDFWVVPPSSALFYGSPNHRNQQLYLSHLTFLYSPKTFGLVSSFVG